MDEGGTYVGRSTWHTDLSLDIPLEDLNSIPDTDREAFFEGMQRFFAAAEGVELTEHRESSEGMIGASAPLRIPGTRVFIRFGDAMRDWYKKLIRTAVLFVVVGNISPVSAFAGLSFDLAFAIFEKLSRLSEADVGLIETVLELSKAKGGRSPSTADIAAALAGDKDDLATRLASLEGRGLIRREEDGWQVVF